MAATAPTLASRCRCDPVRPTASMPTATATTAPPASTGFPCATPRNASAISRVTTRTPVPFRHLDMPFQPLVPQRLDSYSCTTFQGVQLDGRCFLELG